MPDEEKTVLKSLSLIGFSGGGSPCAVDVKDGRIARVRPLHYDWKFTKEEIKPWKYQRNGKIFEVPLKSMPGPFSLAYKKRVYSHILKAFADNV